MLGPILAGGAIASSAIQAGTGIANTIINQKNFERQMQFNENQAQLNRDFQKQMAKNNIKYAVEQAKELGISPSLVLGNQTNSLGGSQASVGSAPTANTSSVGQLGSILGKIYELNTLQEMNEDKLQAQKDMYNIKYNHSARVTDKKYTKEDFNNLFTDINKIKI